MEYEKPEVIFEGELEVEAGSPKPDSFDCDGLDFG